MDQENQDAAAQEQTAVDAEQDAIRLDPQAQQRREELVEHARAATAGRPELAALVDSVTALDDVALDRHVQQLDAVHQALREALTSSGHDDRAAR